MVINKLTKKVCSFELNLTENLEKTKSLENLTKELNEEKLLVKHNSSKRSIVVDKKTNN